MNTQTITENSETFTPIEVNLSYTPQTPKSTFTPIEVDLSLPSGVKYDEKLSVIPMTRESLNEWSENHNISILSPRRLSDKNNNCGLKSQMTYSLWERFMFFLTKN